MIVLHDPRNYTLEQGDAKWSMLQVTFREVASQEYTLHEALKRLQARGYRTTKSSDLDMERFKKILVDPYYAGVCQMSTWPVNCHGLHTAMITPEQQERLREIVAGKKKIAHKRFNPKYPLSNLMACTNCLGNAEARYPRLAGYDHTNGKQRNGRRVYEKYRSRCCQKEQTLQHVHGELNRVLESLTLESKKRKEFITALCMVCEREHQDTVRFAQTLQQRLRELTTSKHSLVMAIATGKVTEADGNSALAGINSDIEQLNDEISDAQEIEQDFISFVENTMDFIDEMQRSWWELDEKHMGWCKQLLFPEGFSISRDGKVYIPKISGFYRLASTKKSPKSLLFPIWHSSRKNIYTRYS